MQWVVCPKLSLSIDVKVTAAQCLACGECEKSFDVWLDCLRVLPKVDEQAMLDKKERRKGKCAKAADSNTYCTADLSYCKYNHICSDEHPRKKIMLALKEETMFLKMDMDKKISETSGKTIKEVKITEDVVKVLDVRRKIIKVRTLVPLKKEAALRAPAILAVFKSIKNVLVGDKKDLKAASVKEFIDNPELSEAYIVEKSYVPETTFKIESMVVQKRAPRTPASAKAPGGTGK